MTGLASLFLAITIGQATWYDDGSGYYGAVPTWRWGDTPYQVRVCAVGTGRCVTVTVRDYCACPGDRIIDLSPAAFRKLAPLSRGVIRVTMASALVMPETDTAPVSAVVPVLL